MTTIEKMTLELNAKGVNEFIKSIDTAQESLSGVSNGMKKVLSDSGVLNKKIAKMDNKQAKAKNKIFERENKQKKADLKNNKEINNSLSKIFKTMLAVSGLQFSLSGIKSSAEKSASDGVTLANQARTGTASALELETVKQALKLGGQNANTLDNLINKLSSNQSGFRSNGTLDGDIIKMISMLNYGAKTNLGIYDTDPLETIKEISKALNSIKDPYQRNKTAQYMGLNSAEYSALSDENFNSNIVRGNRLAIQDSKTQKESIANNIKLEEANKKLDNALNKAGAQWTDASVKLTNIYTDLAENSATLAPMVEDALSLVSVLVKGVNAGVSAVFGKNGIYTTTKKEAHQFLDDTEQKQYKAESQKDGVLKYYEDKIESIDHEKGVIKFKDNGGSFDGGLIDWLSYSPYIFKHLQSLINGSDNAINTSSLSGFTPTTGQQGALQAIGAPSSNTSNSYNNAPVNNYNISVNSDASTFSALMDDIEKLKSSNNQSVTKNPFISGNIGTIFPHMSNLV